MEGPFLRPANLNTRVKSVTHALLIGIVVVVLSGGLAIALVFPRRQPETTSAVIDARRIYVNQQYGFAFTYAARFRVDWETDYTITLYDGRGAISFYVEDGRGRDLEGYAKRRIPPTSSSLIVNRTFRHISGIMVTTAEARGWPAGSYERTFYFARDKHILRLASNGPDWNEFENILNSFEFTDPVTTSEHNS